MKKIILLTVIGLIIISMFLSNKSTNYFKYDENTYLAVLVDGEKQNNFPEKGNYKVKVTCNNSHGKWDYDNWKLIIDKIKNNSKCAINFKSVTPDNFADYIKSLEDSNQGEGKLINETLTDFEPDIIKEQAYYTNLVNDSSYPFTWNATDKTWTSTNKTDYSESEITFNPEVNGPVAVCYTVSSEEDYDGAIFYVNDVIKGKVSGSYTGCIYLGNLTTLSIVKIAYIKDRGLSSGNDNVIFSINEANILDIKNRGYRYQGKNPNNWIMFNGEYWQIIGVFDSETHGRNDENLVKIIRTEAIGTLAWNKNNVNDWSTASLKTLLNDNYYNGVNESSITNCYGHAYYGMITGNCNFIKDGITNETYRNMIENVTWKLGGTTTSSATTGTFYTAERSAASTTGYIGLLYVSDYGYSVLESSCVRSTYLSEYDDSSCAGQSWLYSKGEEWTLTRYSGNSINLFFIPSSGTLTNYYASLGYGVRPTLYLKSDIKKLAGDGSYANPYIIVE